MNTETFDNIINEQLQTCKDVLISKAKEYATDDRLHNFKVAAAIQGCTPIKALAGMMAKHTVSIYDMCNGTGCGMVYTLARWEEKITDSINYLLLLKALVKESDT